MTYFDETAASYDQLFTFSEIGKKQRRHVWLYLEKVLPKNKSWNILELNCGTGEDALFFAEKEHHVLATDISGKMVEVTRQKVQSNGFEELVTTKTLNIEALNEQVFDRKFDLVLSNFGGLNCLPKTSLARLSDDLSRVLKHNGRFIAIVMPRFCLWEHLYFLLKLKPSEILRRTQEKVMASGEVPTWYYSPREFSHIFHSRFKYVDQKPIGIALPPSYLEPFFAKRKSWLSLLDKLEHQVNRIALFSSVADHFLIDLKRK